MALFSSKESFTALHSSLAILKQMIVDQGKTFTDEAKALRSNFESQLKNQISVVNGNVLDGHTDMKIFLTEQEEKRDRQWRGLAAEISKGLEECVQILRVLNQAAAVQKVQSEEILRLLNEALDKQRTDVTELQRKVVILQARKA